MTTSAARTQPPRPGATVPRTGPPPALGPPVFLVDDDAGAPAAPVRTVMRNVDAVRSAHALVPRILAAAGEAPIERLRLYGHGVEDRPRADPASGFALDLYTASVVDWRALRGRLARGAIIELYGCSVGGGPRGEGLLRRIASETAATVVAGVQLHVAHPFGVAGVLLVAKARDGGVEVTRKWATSLGGEPTQRRRAAAEMEANP